MQHVDVSLLAQINDLDTNIQHIEDLDVHAKKIMSNIREIAFTVLTIVNRRHVKNVSGTTSGPTQLGTNAFMNQNQLSDSDADFGSRGNLMSRLQETNSIFPYAPILSVSPKFSPRNQVPKASGMPTKQVGSARFVAPSSPPLRLASFGARAAPPADANAFDVIDYINGVTLSSTLDSASRLKHTAVIKQPLSNAERAEFRRYIEEDKSLSETPQSAPVSAREDSYADDSFESESRPEKSLLTLGADVLAYEDEDEPSDTNVPNHKTVLNDKLGIDFWPSKHEDENDHMRVHVYNGCLLFQNALDGEIIEWSNMYNKRGKKGSTDEDLLHLKKKLDAGAYPDARDTNGATLLLRAVQNGEHDNFQLAKLLLCYCVDVEAADIHKNTPLSFFSNETMAKLKEGGKACARQLSAQFAYMREFKQKQFDLIKKIKSPDVIHQALFQDYYTQFTVLIHAPFLNRNDIRDLAIAQIFQWGLVNKEMNDHDYRWLYQAIKTRNVYAVEILLQHQHVTELTKFLDPTQKWIDKALTLVTEPVPADTVQEKMIALLNLKKINK